MRFPAFVIALVWVTAAGAGTAPAAGFDTATLPAAFGPPAADTAAIAVNVRQRLPSSMSVVHGYGLVVATSDSMEEAAKEAERIARLDATLRRRAFPNLEHRPIIVVVAGDGAALRGLAESLYPALSGGVLPTGGFYHPIDRLIVTETVAGDATLLRELTRAHLRDDNPDAPHWFEQALVTLYESVEPRDDRLVPILNRRMNQISPDQDLSYAVFAGICDCSPISEEQIALMRLLFIFLEGRDQLPQLLATIAALGQYTTLLQALDGMNFDGATWKAFAERSVGDYASCRKCTTFRKVIT